jgi:hypothetical protein
LLGAAVLYAPRCRAHIVERRSVNPDFLGMTYLRPWILGGGAWFLVSLVVLLDYRRLPDPSYLYELWLLLSLLWLEFPFAGLFSCLRRGRYERVPALVLIALAPPMLLHAIVFFLIR